MPDIKVTSTLSPEPSALAEKELSFARQQAEIKEKEAVLQEVSKAILSQRKKIQSSDEDTKQEQSKDTAQISDTRRQLSTDGTISSDQILKWVLEMAGKDWESFLEWQPTSDMDLPSQLQELSRLYLALLEAALKYAEGDNLTQQMDRLDSLLAEKLNLVMEWNLEELTSLLEETGQNAALDTVRSSLYRQTAGRTISPQTAHSFFAHGGTTGRSTGLLTSSSLGRSSKEGMIYQSSGKQNVRYQQTYHTQQTSWKEQLKERRQTISNARKGIPENTFRQGSSVSCSGRELEKANRFAAHIEGSGNLFKNPAITARNDEVTGLLAAVMSIKGQVYTEENGRTASITYPLENAIEKIINQYLSKKGVSNVYYHTLTAYKQTKNPKKAIEDGQDYAYRQFQAKQREPAYQKSPHYSKDSGFFRSFLKGLNPEKEFALGVNILEKDWQRFLYALGNGEPSSYYASRMGLYSPWGLLAGNHSRGTGTDGNMVKILLGTSVMVILGVMTALYFQFF